MVQGQKFNRRPRPERSIDRSLIFHRSYCVLGVSDLLVFIHVYRRSLLLPFMACNCILSSHLCLYYSIIDCENLTRSSDNRRSTSPLCISLWFSGSVHRKKKLNKKSNGISSDSVSVHITGLSFNQTELYLMYYIIEIERIFYSQLEDR